MLPLSLSISTLAWVITHAGGGKARGSELAIWRDNDAHAAIAVIAASYISTLPATPL